MREEDILLWPDGSWCFRFELRLRDGLIRDYQYRVVSYQSDEWDKVAQTRAYTGARQCPPPILANCP